MDSKTIQVCIVVAGKIVSSLVIGEVLGSAVSRPIAAWRAKQFYAKAADAKAVGTMFDVMNQRIFDLEEKVLGESK